MDMVTMNIIDSTLVSICREMGLTMMKTAYSTIFNEGMDFTCGLGNTKGEMIGVAEFNPSQIGGLPLVLQTTSQEIPPDSLAEGDVIVTNDPYRGGMHTPEHSFIKPVFVAGVLYGYAVAIGHVAEVGGMVPGGFAGEATEIFHEGLRVPPIKIKKAGKNVDEVWKLMLANVRTPRANYGDYCAMISAVDVGVARLEAVIEQLDVDLVILAVPASAAQEIADRAVEAGVRGILNFAPVQIKVPDSIPVEDVNLVMQLEALSFKITRGGAGE